MEVLGSIYRRLRPRTSNFRNPLPSDLKIVA